MSAKRQAAVLPGSVEDIYVQVSSEDLARWRELAAIAFPGEARDNLDVLEMWIIDACQRKADEADALTEEDWARIGEAVAKLAKRKGRLSTAHAKPKATRKRGA